ncbi:LuxR C-terminal-related transcriptional regulator [Aquabacterium sp.]|uniref:LuxR C-terminal-related transcriptional regulator n=1 Tax=Aquabacterium sp. TaxID=1872578 RepID=UPI0037835B6C
MMAAPAFAVTRIQPPRRPPGWVARPRLQQRLLEAVQQQPVTLLCAAAGYGKTAALAQLIHELPPGTALAWVDADEDEQLPTFLACLCAALASLQLPWRVAPDALATLALADRGLREVASTLVNALAGADCPRGLIVLDDGHRIVDARVFELLQMLIERLPAQWGVVLASRTEPPLALARWRAADRLAEFRQADLQFDAGEVQALVQAAQPAGAAAAAAELADQARQLLQRTQGWAAGLRLSLSVGRQATQAGERLTQRHLFDFLATEVLAEMPPRLREFLLRSAVLPELTAERCARVTGMADAAELLDEVDRRGLFVSVLAAEQPTWRLHDLFRDFLEDRLRREQPAQWQDLLRSAAQDEPDLARAVGYLQRAGAWEAALGVLAQRGLALLATGGASSLLQMLAQFPPEQYARLPDLWLLRGLCAWPGYDFDQLRHCMHQAVAGYAEAGRERDAALASAHLSAALQHMGRFEEGTRILARLGRLQLDDAAMAFIHYGEACDAVVCGRPADVAANGARMLAALQRVPEPGLWQQCPLQVMMVGAPGTAAHSLRYGDAILQVAGHAPSPLRAGAWHARCWAALLAGRIDEAASALARADEDFRWLGSPRMIQTDNGMLHGLLQALRGEALASRAAGEALIEDIRRAASASFRRVHEPAMLFNQARAAWLLGDVALLREMDAAMRAVRHPAEWPSGVGAHAMVAAMLALAEDRIADGLQQLALLDARFDCYFLCAGVQAATLHAWALARSGRLDEAAARLQPLLQGPGDDERGAAVLAGVQVLDDLRAQPWQGRLAPPALARLDELLSRARRARAGAAHPAHLAGSAAPALAASVAPAAAEPVESPTPGPAAVAAPGAARPPALEQLTPREAQILALLAAGDSNKLIARALNLSVHTVKQHVASVLGKLGVASRGQAAAWWHARGK